MNYDQILKRADKALKKLEGKTKQSGIHIVPDEDGIASLVGLVIVLAMEEEEVERQAA